jgi:hypothetical protein
MEKEQNMFQIGVFFLVGDSFQSDVFGKKRAGRSFDRPAP